MKKIYVVTLDNCSRRNPTRDRIIVRAASEEAAIKLARGLSWIVTGASHATAREAHPIYDLGCQTKAKFLESCDSMERLRALHRETKAEVTL